MSITGFSSQSKRTCSLKIQFQTFLSLIIVFSWAVWGKGTVQKKPRINCRFEFRCFSGGGGLYKYSAFPLSFRLSHDLFCFHLKCLYLWNFSKEKSILICLGLKNSFSVLDPEVKIAPCYINTEDPIYSSGLPCFQPYKNLQPQFCLRFHKHNPVSVILRGIDIN